MNLNFKYDLHKDVENFLKGLNSVNSQVPTKLQEEFSAKHGSDTSTDTVSGFLKERGGSLDFNKKIEEICSQWKPIENIFTSRCEEMFGISILPATAYISLSQKCTYNWRDDYFFVYFDSKYPTKTIMHELLHFYTHRKYQSQDIEQNKFNDIKESLTVILNSEFADLMGDAVDTGYPQHQEIRSRIVELRKEGRSIDEIVTLIAQS